ncbi:MAG: hypothetical protein ABIJ18_03045 [archaeon]
MEEKEFNIKFQIRDGRIATKMTSKNMQVQEKIGLLEIAKQQVLDEVRKTKRDIFKGYKDE